VHEIKIKERPRQLMTSEPEDNAEQTELEREAFARLRHLMSGNATVADVEDTTRWRRQSEAHADAFAFAHRLWDRLGTAGRNVLERRGEQPLTNSPPVVRRRLTRRTMLGGAVAASAAYVIIRPPLDLWPSFSELTADYRTATGEQRRIALTEGASIQLNTQTSIALRRAGDQNDLIELINGEAAVTMAQQLTRPLVVIAGDGRISAENASFNVRYDGRTSCVTCLAGTVRVERQDAATRLEAHHQVTYADRGLETPAVVDPAVVTAWQSGLLVFRETPLSEVVAEINRYRPGKIMLLNTNLGRRPVNARFRVGNVDEIMSLAQQIFGAKVTSLPGGIVLLS
jgi:transmembrane sensor